jgi:G3E family GTPase
MQSAIPLTVIGGYLGSGKTTLLNALLRQPHGKRFALLVNDFGSINIDAELIENQQGETINLANGCICCSLAAGFVVALNTVLNLQSRPDQVIIEASGVADPRKIANYGNTPGFSLQGILVVMDAETIQTKSRDKYVGKTVIQQIKAANLLILNKIDLVTDAQKHEVCTWLAGIAPQARIIETQYGVVPVDLLLEIESQPNFWLEGDFQTHGAMYASGSYENDIPFERPFFEAWLAMLPETVLRAKGVIFLQEDPERRFVLQMVGARWKLTPDQAWGNEKPQSRLVWISLKDQFDPDLILKTLKNIRANGPVV